MSVIMKHPWRCPTCGKPLFDCGCLDNGKVIAKLDSKNRMKYIYLKINGTVYLNPKVGLNFYWLKKSTVAYIPMGSDLFFFLFIRILL